MPIFSGLTISGGFTYDAPPPPPGGSLQFSFTDVKYADDPDFDMGTGDFTVEWFGYQTSSSNGGWFYNGFWAETRNNFFQLGFNGTIYGTIAISNYTNVWSHWAISRSGTTMRVFRNGTQIGSNISNSADITRVGNFSIGIGYNVTLTGRLTNFNWVKGTALYTSNFTPPSGPISPNANSKLLLLVKTDPTKLVDSSGNGKVPTSAGSATFSDTTPFPFSV